MSYFTIRKSIWGKLLGISATGGLVMGVKSTGATLGGSTDVNMAAQMWGPGMTKTLTSADGVTISNSGETYLAAGTTSGSTMFLAAPVAGIRKRIFNLATTATALTINPLGGALILNASSGGGSTTLILCNSTVANSFVTLNGISTALWVVIGKSTAGLVST